MKILYAASEANPFAKSGGLADVAGALPKELVKAPAPLKRGYRGGSRPYGYCIDQTVWFFWT